MVKSTFGCIRKILSKYAKGKLIASILICAIAFVGVLSTNSIVDVSNNDSFDIVTSETADVEETAVEVVETVTVNDIPVRLGSFDVVPSYGAFTDDEPIKTTEYVTVTKTINFKTVRKETDELRVGQTKVQQKGSNGEKEVTYIKEIVDGKTVASWVDSEKVIKEAVDKIILVGTRFESNKAVQTSADVKCISTLKPSSPIELDENGIPCSYKKVMKGKASAYACGTTCATGVKVQPGYIAVNPKIIPYGTKMYIVSDDGKYVYGYAVAADTGGFAKKGKRIADLYFPTVSQCFKFGVRNITIYFLD